MGNFEKVLEDAKAGGVEAAFAGIKNVNAEEVNAMLDQSLVLAALVLTSPEGMFSEEARVAAFGAMSAYLDSVLAAFTGIHELLTARDPKDVALVATNIAIEGAYNRLGEVVVPGAGEAFLRETLADLFSALDD